MTQIQKKRESQYRKSLRQCGFRSWKRANLRRGELIAKSVYGQTSDSEELELAGLQRLADLYVKWKTNDATGRSIRRLKRLQKKIGTN